MIITVYRLPSGHTSTGSLVYVNGERVCFGLEDEERDLKIAGETRIWAGQYKLGMRTYGGLHKRYQELFDFHRGMIEVLGVPNFSDVLIHCGNTEQQTAGCLLVGSGIQEVGRNGDFQLIDSRTGYRKLYTKIINAVANGDALIQFRDVSFL